MAQRTIHYLFGEIFSQHVELKDKKRFLLGSVLPDAFTDVADRDKTHFKHRMPELNKTYFDFDKFKEQYFDLMQKDDLYLGYYMHLVEDAFYRDYIYCGRFTMPKCRDEVPLLHNDYHILNSYVTEKYKISNILEPVAISGERICEIAYFRAAEFIEEMANDFMEQTKGQTVFVTEAMLDEFVEEYAMKGVEELKNIQRGTDYLKAIDLAYPIHR
ncbi:MAG: hypothetical protein IJ035_01185 [Oscillospiraceae bacterium]|nr:hypothetical protein [Oscillospiraceae bacterium]